MRTILDYSFCISKIETLSFNDELENIMHNAFSDCSNLVSIAFPDNLKQISSNCFINCNNLTSVVLPKNLQKLGGLAFPPKVKLSFGEDSQLIVYENTYIMNKDKTYLSQCLSTKADIS